MIRTLAELATAHEFTEYQDGDGFNEPVEEWVGCSCGAEHWSHIQHADCECHFPETASVAQQHAEHVLAMAIRARLARSKGRS